MTATIDMDANFNVFGKDKKESNFFYECLFFSLLELFLSHEDTEKLHDFEEECMEDLYREKEMKHHSSTEERIKFINERLDNGCNWIGLGSGRHIHFWHCFDLNIAVVSEIL